MKEKTASDPSRIIWPYDMPDKPMLSWIDTAVDVIAVTCMAAAGYGMTVILFGVM
jgi:hypothetical protein